VPLVDASITDSLVTFATNVIDHLGVAGVFVLMLLESACIPIPSEATMLFAGFTVSNGDHTLWAMIVAGVLGNLVGSWIAYGVGYAGRVELLERRLHVKRHHLEWADRWFERYGSWAVFFSRLLPVIRTFISLPAGVARMPFWRFTVLTLAGCVPWVLALAIIGREVGDRWTKWRDALHYVDLAVAALLVLAILYAIARWWRSRRAANAAADVTIG
jgi:membrane protein DedA with SNARE-associated domain